MACSGRYAEADEFALFWCIDLPLGSDQEDRIEAMLDLSAGEIHANRAAANACSCTEASWTVEFLKYLNVLMAAIKYNCPCGSVRITDDMRAEFLGDIRHNLTMIRTGELELCEGETGINFPAVAWAEHSVTEWNTARIAWNTLLRYP